MKNKRNILALLLAMLLTVMLADATVIAADAETPMQVGTTDNGSFQYVEVSDSIRIIKYIGYDTEITVPENIDGKKVTIIGEGAFSQSTNITKVTLPGTIVSIEAKAFASVTSLKK